MAVSEQSVRDLLDNPPAKSVPSATVTGNIDRSDRFIDKVKSSDANNTDVDDAKRALAVWLTFGSYAEGITQQLGSISEIDRTKLDHLRKVAELFINNISSVHVDLDTDKFDMNTKEGIPPSAWVMTTSEAYPQE